MFAKISRRKNSNNPKFANEKYSEKIPRLKNHRKKSRKPRIPHEIILEPKILQRKNSAARNCLEKKFWSWKFL